ncbi:MarR family winged helix-turn-helix transcriptional regulator [Nocardia macrotermitis]|uniref:Putative HTH-type transcriptional regulator n=1 Tax=Nocardia macrotermitis TaxID=2585198 RepID=A0A7K0D8A8_9NOCA|nr:MarR family transcriptional regulator [Nocardia macrotermitis]MQY21996.1 putative HTH-type transcriptional regulator [Nocardia macrotermitis]
MDQTPGDVSESAVRASRELRTAVGRLRRRLNELADNRELTPTQTAVLSRLGKQGDASASELAAAERVRPQSMAATLAVLDERGLIHRRPDPRDGRKQLVSLSPAGRAIFEDRSRSGQEWLARQLEDNFTEAERTTILEAAALMERLIQLDS